MACIYHCGYMPVKSYSAHFARGPEKRRVLDSVDGRSDADSAPSQARVGSAVTLWGEGLSADEVAAASGTVSYELFCALAARVPVEE